MDIIHAIGRRKEAVARIYLSKGKGSIIVNGKDFKEYFPVQTMQYKLEQPFKITDLLGKMDGVEVCIDFKQSNKPKKIDYIQDYFLQLGAYTLSHDVVHGTKMRAGVILLCTKDILFQEFKITS